MGAVARTKIDPSPLKALRHLLQDQAPGACGPASTSAVLSLLGIDASAAKIVDELPPLRRWIVPQTGVGEDVLIPVARRLGAEVTLLPASATTSDSEFLRHLEAHLAERGGAVLSVHNQGHWVAAVGVLANPRRFVIMDPSTKQTETGFHVLDDAAMIKKCRADAKPPFYAFMAGRADHRPPVVRVNDQLITAANAKGLTSGARLGEAFGDWADILRRKLPAPATDGVLLDEWLSELEGVVVEALDYWRAVSVKAEPRSRIERRFRDYVATASTLGIRVADERVRLEILAELVSIMSYYAGGRSTAAKPVGVAEAFDDWRSMLRDVTVEDAGGGPLLRDWLPEQEAYVVDALDYWRSPSVQAESRAAIKRKCSPRPVVIPAAT